MDSKSTNGSGGPDVTPPFSMYTSREKWALIGMTSLAGFFSPLSSNIYFPAIPLLSQDFGVSVSLMNLTITVYLICQGISPMVWAPLADTKGRRPVYISKFHQLPAALLNRDSMIADNCVSLGIGFGLWRCIRREAQAEGEALAQRRAKPDRRVGGGNRRPPSSSLPTNPTHFHLSPSLLVCLSVLSITCIALALVPTSKWWLLLIFRCLQGSGSASTVALGSGVIADIATPAERGGFLGFTMLGMLLGSCIGPVIGGLLMGSLGWRWIFWFLCILSTACLVLIVLFLPETLRRIVGNGSQPAPRWWGRPLIPVIGPSRRRSNLRGQTQPTAPPSPKTPLRSNPFLLLLEPDIMFMLLSTAFTYGLFVTIQSTTSFLFQQAYSSLTEKEVGLCFIPMGIGCFMSSAFTGKQLDWEYKRCRRRWEEKRKVRWEEARGASEKQRDWVDGNLESPSLPPPSKEEELTFHVEKARLRWSFLYTGLSIVSCIGNGWALDKRVHMAVPLIIEFVAGWVIAGQMNSIQTLLIDVMPAQGASTTAINNFVRCLLGAGVISVVNPIIDAIGVGWTYTLLSLIGAVAIPIFTLVVIRYGPRWRTRRWKKRNQN